MGRPGCHGRNCRCPDAMHRGASAQAGFTLVELLIAMTIVALIALVTMPVLLSAYRHNRRMSAEFDMRSQGLALLRELEFGVMEGANAHPGLLAASGAEVSRDDGVTMLSFVSAANVITSFIHDGFHLQKRIGTDGSAVTVLANVSRFFVCSKPLGTPGQVDAGETVAIEVQLRQDGNPPGTVDLATEIYLRNVHAGQLNVPPC